MAVDHCFSIRGQGTVMTGTILQGSLAINDTVEIPVLKVCSKKMGTNLEFLIYTSTKHSRAVEKHSKEPQFRKFRS